MLLHKSQRCDSSCLCNRVFSCSAPFSHNHFNVLIRRHKQDNTTSDRKNSSAPETSQNHRSGLSTGNNSLISASSLSSLTSPVFSPGEPGHRDKDLAAMPPTRDKKPQQHFDPIHKISQHAQRRNRNQHNAGPDRMHCPPVHWRCCRMEVMHCIKYPPAANTQPENISDVDCHLFPHCHLSSFLCVRRVYLRCDFGSTAGSSVLALSYADVQPSRCTFDQQPN